MKELKLTEQERKMHEIEVELESFYKATSYSKIPLKYLGMIAGLNLVIWLISSIYVNPGSIVPMYNGIGPVFFQHFWVAFNQTFFYGLLPYLLVFLFIGLLFWKVEIPTINVLRKKLEQGENLVIETVKKLKFQGQLKRMAILVIFIGMSVITASTISFELEEIYIYDAIDLDELSPNDMNKRIVLMDDINMEYQSGAIFYDFTGVFDGDGHTISNLNIGSDRSKRVSLFGNNYGTIANVHFENMTVTGKESVAALTRINQGTIINVSIDGLTMNSYNGDYDVTHSVSIFSIYNLGVIKDISIKNVEYFLEGDEFDADVDIDVSGITMGNQGSITNAHVAPYVVDHDFNLQNICLVSCDSYDFLTANSSHSDIPIDVTVYEDSTLDFDDDSFVTCIGCTSAFDLRNQIYETAKTYKDIQYPVVE